MENNKILNGEIHDPNDPHHENGLDDLFSPDLFNKEFKLLTNRDDLTQMLKSRLIDLTKDEPKIDYLLTRNGIGCLSKGDFQIIKGRKKAGKSTFIAILVTAFIKGEFMGFNAVKQGLKVLYIDTEQNRSNTAKINENVNILCGKELRHNHPQFTAYNLRGDNPIIRKKLITQAIAECKPDLVIIDGIKDLLETGDINNPSDSHAVVQLLMELTEKYNFPILTVIHENKGDTELRGHLGTEIGHKMSEEWQLVKSNEVFTVKQVENRNERSGAISFQFKLDERTLPELINDRQKVELVDKTKLHKLGYFQKCLPVGTSRNNKDLTAEYRKISTYAKSTAEKDIKDFKQYGYLIHEEKSKDYRFNFDKVTTENIPSIIP